MHLIANRLGVVLSIIGMSLMGRGMGMGSAALLWGGVSLTGVCMLLVFLFRYRAGTAPASDEHKPPASSGQCPDGQ
jgi:hypothetical protein